ncbi:MAG: hypothetical protein SGJ11_14980 [Phycisphaerae bacterium]|nr:hypothetical protein [Phycisphaerae bacterium]
MNLSTTRCIALVAASLVTAVAAAQDPFAYEGFQYGPGPELNGRNGGAGWSNAWGKLSSIPTGIANTGLSWPNLITSGNGAYTAGFPSTTFTLYTRVLAPYTATDDTIYVSFLMEPGLGFGEGGGLSFSAVPAIIVGASLGQSMYGLTAPFVTSNDSNVPVLLRETALLVTRIVRNGDGTSTYTDHS